MMYKANQQPAYRELEEAYLWKEPYNRDLTRVGSINDIVNRFASVYSDKLPDYKNAMTLYQNLDIYANIDYNSNSPVKSLSEKRGYSRRTIQRAENNDPRLAELIRGAPLYNSESSESGLGEPEPKDIYQKYDYINKALESIVNSPEFIEKYNRTLAEYNFLDDDVLTTIDQRINIDYTPEQARILKQNRINNLKQSLFNTLYDSFLATLPYEARLYALARDVINSSTSYEEGKRMFEQGYFALLNDKYNGDIEEICEAAGQCPKTVKNKLENNYKLISYFSSPVVNAYSNTISAREELVEPTELPGMHELLLNTNLPPHAPLNSDKQEQFEFPDKVRLL